MLLGMKKRGFGAGKWNGFGGKVEPHETIEAAAKREIFEEIGIETKSLHKMGMLDFFYPHQRNADEVHIFKTDSFTGEPRETEEMKPQWFGIEEIPFYSMWEDDKFWLPLLLKNIQFTGAFHFGADDEIISSTLIQR